MFDCDGKGQLRSVGYGVSTARLHLHSHQSEFTRDLKLSAPKHEVVGRQIDFMIVLSFDKQTRGAFCSRAGILQDCKRQFNCTLLYHIRIDSSSSKEV